MPDQHTAATEHELFTKIAEPLGDLPEDPLAAVPVDFPVALRGYDRFAVDAYVQRTSQLIAELQSTRSPQAAVRRALERVGEEISGILQRAHDTSDEITARSRSEAEERLETARREATEIASDAERRVKELDAETERIWAERHSIVTDAQELARRLTELAETALERFPADGSSPDYVRLDAEPPEWVPPAPVSAHLFDGAVEAEVGEADDSGQADGSPGADHEEEPTMGHRAVAEPVVDGPSSYELPAYDLPLYAPPMYEPPMYEPPMYEPPVYEAPADEATVDASIADEATLDASIADEPTVGGEPTVDEPTRRVDEPTVAMPAIEPWEDGDGPPRTGDH